LQIILLRTGEKIMERRKFLKEMGKWSMGILLAEAGLKISYAGEISQEFQSPGFTRTPLPDACILPFTDVEKTLAAVIDTVVPGAETDPDKEPGALEACAMNLLFDDYYPFRSYANLIAGLMDTIAQNKYSKNFIDLNLDERVAVLVESEEMLPVLRLAYRAIRSAFYGGAYNGVGLSYVQYPGPNLGFRHIKEASFRKAVCKEMTFTGWME
jgi:hypothetical protein